MKDKLEQAIILPIPVDDGSTGVEFEDTSSDEPITEPFDPSKIRVATRTMTIDLLLSRIEHNELDLSPGFQRKAGIWNDQAQSRLIESLLIRIPIPAFYVDATDEDKWLVVDGLQRLTTLKRFVLDESLKLSGLEFLTKLEGSAHGDLPARFKRRIKETQVVVFQIEQGTPTNVKFNIFKRINTSGLPLSAQEIRHALNQGPVTEFLRHLAESEEFLNATAYGISDKRMADREFVLRFMAFKQTPYQNYVVSDFDAFLNETMASMNYMTIRQYKELEKEFIRAMNAACSIFGDDAFRKRYNSEHSRYPVNKALFESWSVNLSQLTNEELNLLGERKATLKKKYIKLMNTRDFNDAISQGTGDKTKVHLRFSKINELIREVLG